MKQGRALGPADSPGWHYRHCGKFQDIPPDSPIGPGESRAASQPRSRTAISRLQIQHIVTVADVPHPDVCWRSELISWVSGSMALPEFDATVMISFVPGSHVRAAELPVLFP